MDNIPPPDKMPPDEPSRAWWSGTIGSFLTQNITSIVDRLAFRAIETHPTNRNTQLQAWHSTIDILRRALKALPNHWVLHLEYPLIRLGRRMDAVLITDRAIFVLEFKTLSGRFGAHACVQAEDYALDLRDFHAGSREHVIVPVVIAGAGRPSRPQSQFLWPGVSSVYEALPSELSDLLNEILSQIPYRNIDIENWDRAAFRPVPSIIEAARALYGKHGVADIRHARADTENLSRTTDAILQAIAAAKATSSHIILFVTGIPGAGKTLCGLDAIFSPETDGTFLTGTLPMVYVLKAALAEDSAKANINTKRTTLHKTKSKIESITGFLRHYIAEPSHLPEHVIVFDEAQRAWDAEYGARKFNLANSEAAIVLDIMARHHDYAVIIALVGNGQEINSGEAGLAEWGRALSSRLNWKIHAAPGVLTATPPRQKLFQTAPANMIINNSLHLDVPIRNVRSQSAAPWVDAVLRGDAAEARRHAPADLPFFITRSLDDMRIALRQMARGTRRAGLVCSSGAKRLVADGLWPKFEHMNENAVANWFLKTWPDVRASDALEIPATEFACQGLELDFVGLCWGGDLSWTGNWKIRNFRGSEWQNRANQNARDYRINTYRVLLTRARADTIIWIPAGNPADQTRTPEGFDRTADFLLTCGARRLPIIKKNETEPSLL